MDRNRDSSGALQTLPRAPTRETLIGDLPDPDRARDREVKVDKRGANLPLFHRIALFEGIDECVGKAV